MSLQFYIIIAILICAIGIAALRVHWALFWKPENAYQTYPGEMLGFLVIVGSLFWAFVLPFILIAAVILGFIFGIIKTTDMAIAAVQKGGADKNGN